MTPIEQAVVLLHFQSAQANAALNALPAREQAMIAAVDPRAFRADAERRARAAAVVAEELPVSCAVLGAGAVFAFFDDVAFVAVVRGEDGLVPAAARWLEPRAGDVAVLEGAIARARRRRALPAGGGLTLPAGVGVCALAAGTLEAFARARAALGPAPHDSVARGARVDPFAPSSEREHVLIAGADLSRISAPLFSVLAACAARVAEQDVLALAVAEGADASEARDLVDELLTDGLLAR